MPRDATWQGSPAEAVGVLQIHGQSLRGIVAVEGCGEGSLAGGGDLSAGFSICQWIEDFI
jgi:hypothetical protein